jgi:uncharacterized protein
MPAPAQRYDGLLPGRHAIDAYGQGGFRFAGMSHRGSLLFLPSAVRRWAPAAASGIDEAAIAPILAEAGDIELLLVGLGRDPFGLPKPVAVRLRAAGLAVDPMTTGAAASTYNILLGEGRRVAAALIAVD